MLHEQPEDALAALDGCIVTRAEAIWADDQIEYTALHAAFERVPMGSTIPQYRPVIAGGRRTWEAA
jgi:dihydrofolate reductase